MHLGALVLRAAPLRQQSLGGGERLRRRVVVGRTDSDHQVVRSSDLRLTDEQARVAQHLAIQFGRHDQRRVFHAWQSEHVGADLQQAHRVDVNVATNDRTFSHHQLSAISCQLSA